MSEELPDEDRSLTRRSTLRTLGALLIGGGAAGTGGAAQTDGSYRVTQGDETFAVEPLSGDAPVERFYGFHLPGEYTGTGETGGDGGAFYESTGTRDLQRESTTITFLYDGPNGLSLVVVHGDSGSSGGGAVTWRVSVRPGDAEWLVKDDAYWATETGERASTNYDTWATDGGSHRIDWTWAAGATDGGVLGYLGDAGAVRIRPDFNEAAALYGRQDDGEITDWEFLSGDRKNPERVALALDESVAVTGPASGALTDRSGDGVTADGGTSTDDAPQDDGGEVADDAETDDGDETSDETRQATGDDAGDAADENDGETREDDEAARADDEAGRVEDERGEGHENGRGEEGENGPGKSHTNGRGDGPEGKAKGHGNDRGRGHENGRGRGHEKAVETATRSTEAESVSRTQKVARPLRGDAQIPSSGRSAR